MTINFTAKLAKIGAWTILLLPKSASAKLPSRGMTMVTGTINGSRFQAALEPDGKGSHWFRVDKLKTGDMLMVTVALEPMKELPEPDVPSDVMKALAASSEAKAVWMDITPNARWDWVRWIRSTKSSETRKRRIDVAISKLRSGDRRPCCFNRSQCCEPDVSNNGVLLEPTAAK